MRSAAEQNRQYFHEAYETGLHGWAAEPSPPVARNLARVAQTPGPRRLLDLGCGEGRHCLAAARLGFAPVGVDYEPGAIRRAQARAREAGLQALVRFLVADILALPFKAQAFDVLLDYGCLHHQRKADWNRYLAALRWVLKPGGHLLLSTFSTNFRAYGLQDRPWHLAHGAYRRFFTADALQALFAGEFEFLSLEEEAGERSGMWHALLRRRTEQSAG